MRTLTGFGKDRTGNVATVMALCAVPVLFAAFGALEMVNTHAERARLQDAVDAGALAGAGRLSVASTTDQGPVGTAIATAQRAITDAGIKSDVHFVATVATDRQSITVDATADHKAIAGFMGFGDAQIKVTATAENLGSVPLCVLQTASKGKGGIDINDQARVRATGCAIHANTNVTVKSGAMIQATKTQAVGTVTGPVSPQGNAGAMAIPDPFAAMNLNPSTECEGKPKKIKEEKGTTIFLPAGVHCEHYIVDQDATLVLQPGEHWFMDDLEAKKNATLRGDDVTLIFGSTKKITFADRAVVQLGARRSGPFAGFLLVTTRDNTQSFSIASDHVSKLLGTIYIPGAELKVSTAGNVAQDSAWSIIVADTITVEKNPVLVINSGYGGSGVPVPDGVGPRRNNATLSK
ncbi:MULTISPECIES: TadE/TadG family type IV pilus assembly protein [Asticcacaulis]|uniref:TadE/TadG family type IV pilus assembly protein n=1 Tax=Asticcacaulis TaxID=76890 RepID=UPI001AE57614|nr:MULTISPECIES: TadE/TadG family type IV pilus assembly protein [Asticcacaulis]MBP2158719.1 Flp pilus assembly protein TadG [Asticcacaulis solisilvae]MDR6799765.1 Flp pilus assembly protein TadG [Asticcacaulis sp. BE141]